MAIRINHYLLRTEKSQFSQLFGLPRIAQKLCCAAMLGCLTTTAWAEGDGVVKVLGVSNTRLVAAQESQERVDKLADQTVDLIQEYKALQKEIEALRVNNAQVQAKIQDQNNQITEIDNAIVGVQGVQQQIPALLVKMLDGLEMLVEKDAPFLLDERQTRVEKLRANLSKANQSIAENFRQVLEAYKIENEYGRKIEAYKAAIDFNGDGQTRSVDVFRVGRIALLYKTDNGEEVGRWNKDTNSWESLDADEWGSFINTGIRIARNEAVKDILQLPIEAPEAAR